MGPLRTRVTRAQSDSRLITVEEGNLRQLGRGHVVDRSHGLPDRGHLRNLELGQYSVLGRLMMLNEWYSLHVAETLARQGLVIAVAGLCVPGHLILEDVVQERRRDLRARRAVVVRTRRSHSVVRGPEGNSNRSNEPVNLLSRKSLTQRRY